MNGYKIENFIHDDKTDLSQYLYYPVFYKLLNYFYTFTGVYTYLYLLTGGSMKQFLNSQHLITFISNTGWSIVLDTRAWELMWRAQKNKKPLHHMWSVSGSIFWLPSVVN